MDTLYLEEELVLNKAERLLSEKEIFTREEYSEVYEEYKKLLRQMKTLVKVADLTQLELKTLSEELSKVSRMDGLTELYNRRYFRELYSQEWQMAMQENSVLSLLMIDIDNFKKYNDTYGHLQGDVCLKEAAAVFRREAEKAGALVARFGGEEFVMLLPGADCRAAEQVAENLNKSMEKLNLIHPQTAVQTHVTISIGIAWARPEKEGDFQLLMDEADRALYQAKADGRNCYRIFQRGSEK